MQCFSLQGLNSRLVPVNSDFTLEQIATSQFNSIQGGGGFSVTPTVNGASLVCSTKVPRTPKESMPYQSLSVCLVLQESVTAALCKWQGQALSASER